MSKSNKINQIIIDIPKPRNPLVAHAIKRKAGSHIKLNKKNLSKGNFKSNLRKGLYD